MSLAKIKQVITHLEEAKDVVFQIIQMNTSKTENTSYISRPISFEPANRMNDFLTETQNKYLDRKRDLITCFLHVYLMMEMKYEIRSEENAVDIQIHDEKGFIQDK